MTAKFCTTMHNYATDRVTLSVRPTVDRRCQAVMQRTTLSPQSQTDLLTQGGSSCGAMSFDFCKLQRLINKIGGSDAFPAYTQDGEFVDDRLTQYGFNYWSDLAPHIPRGADWNGRHPERSGVYAISVVAVNESTGKPWPCGAQHLLYIGSAKNIAKRLSSNTHWLRRCERRFCGPHNLLLVHVLLRKDYLWVERSLIRTLRPLLNIQHNG